MINFRISDAADDWIDQLTAEVGRSRALVIRAMLSIATRHREEVVQFVHSLSEVESPG